MSPSAWSPSKIRDARELTPGPPVFPPGVVPSLWLDGRVTAYSDAGSSAVAAPPLGRVNKVPQPSPLTGSFTAGNTTDARPFRDASSFGFESTPVTALSNGGLNLSGPAGVTLPANNTTIAFNLTGREMPGQTITNGLLYGVDSVGGQFFGPFFQGGELRIASNSNVYATSIVLPLGVPMACVIRIKPNGIDVRANIGGVVSDYSVSPTIPAGTINGLLVGLMTILGSGLNASISQLIAAPGACSNDDREALLSWLLINRPAEAFPVAANFLTMLGDSIGVGYQLFGAQMYSNIALPALEALGAPLKCLQAGFPGYTIAQSVSLFLSTVLPIYSAARSRNVACVQVGTNSLAFGSFTSAQWLSAYYAYCDQLRSVGFKVIACTLLPRTDIGIRGDYETNRLLVNADVAANYAAHADVLLNFASVAGMGAAGDPNGANYLDKVHPAPAGAALLAPAYQAACIAALS